MSTDYDQIMRKSHITFINEIMRQTKTRDSMNDYYPNRLWLDTDTGTFGDAATLVVIDTTDWTQEDCDTWENMTDSERNDYGNAIKYCDVTGELDTQLMKTYKIDVEETVLATYWVDADSEEQAKALWQNGDIMEWNRHATEQNDELISITLDSETTND